MPQALSPPSPISSWETNVRPEDFALARTHPQYGRRLTDQVFRDVAEQGFAIIPAYFPEQQRTSMATSLRKILPPLDELLLDDVGKEEAAAAPATSSGSGGGGHRQQHQGQLNTMFPCKCHADDCLLVIASYLHLVRS